MLLNFISKEKYFLFFKKNDHGCTYLVIRWPRGMCEYPSLCIIYLVFEISLSAHTSIQPQGKRWQRDSSCRSFPESLLLLLLIRNYRKISPFAREMAYPIPLPRNGGGILKGFNLHADEWILQLIVSTTVPVIKEQGTFHELSTEYFNLHTTHKY